jgi:hypothetical protein
VTTPTGPKKVNIWVIERRMVGQYQKGRNLLYLPVLLSPANN